MSLSSFSNNWIYRRFLICCLVLAFLFSPLIQVGEDIASAQKSEQIITSSSTKFNMAYVYFGDTYTKIKNIDYTNGSLEVVSPNFFDLKADGSLDLKVDPIFVTEMKIRGIRVVPFLSNHWDRELGREALKNREHLSTQLANAITLYGLDGVNVDIENVTEIDRASYTDLVRMIREKVPSEKEVSVAVAANPKGWTKGWHGSYDYAALAQYSDYLMLMSYDESYFGGPAGPIASISFVEQSIQYALQQGVAADKIVLGMAFYGRFWNDQELQGGRGISIKRIDELIKKYNGRIVLDPLSQSPKAMFTIKETDDKLVVGGRALAEGNYTIWFENDESIKRKLQLVSKYNLKGSGSWSLGQELPSLWTYFSTWLNGKYFIDTAGHWAEADIYTILEKGWMRGTNNSHFSPSRSMTRAEVAVTIVRALGLKNNGESILYSDVSDSYWARNEIEIVAQNGIMRGIGVDNFGPQQTLTREQFAVILARVLSDSDVIDEAAPIGLTFTDINSSHWAYHDVLMMTQRGIIRGYSDGRFGVKESVNRAQAATLMNRMDTVFQRLIRAY